MKYIVALIAFFCSISANAQQKDEEVIQKIYSETLTHSKTYDWLRYLSKHIGARLSGSPEAAAAVEFTRQLMDTLALDRVYLQEVMVPHWVRGEKEYAAIINAKSIGTKQVNVCALGNAVGTGPAGLTAGIVEIKNFEELAKLGKKAISGKIVFFNRALSSTHFDTFEAYSGAVNQRSSGASEAAKYGAVGVVVRSMTTSLDDVPHTGALRYAADLPKLPAVAISTNDADLLSSLIKGQTDLQFHFRTHCQILPDVRSYNVVGEIKGSQHPEEIIVVGGHLDSWDLGEGAHDDGAGCVQAIEVLRVMKSLGIKPKRTIRAVMFMNEENGLRGGTKYAELAAKEGNKHIVAIESDRGGFTPREFSADTTPEKLAKMAAWIPLLKPYGISDIGAGEGGADIGPLKPLGTALMEFVPDPQRYFDVHHTAEDTFEKVNKRELELGAGAMTALVYLLAEYGL
ncbi:M20/M25/M40 family metallo-hydrolase [Rhodocytophaga aerolata]|uniref:Carboxypeptidase Q n=1 Tax=Rhodocytophaga aerolata TaxID=455078 RepID=A0ABT8R252_9BACT|nr:M20/M25/M40 family metallo-hydrolase [Rhodocytophaga aerolata]MDO1444715.1 M20/M25/M40 family metallo-hydrolase [Rhodocytophaga aerolata]